MKRKCETCRWWKPTPSLERIEPGSCRCKQSTWYGEESDSDDTCKNWETQTE